MSDFFFFKTIQINVIYHIIQNLGLSRIPFFGLQSFGENYSKVVKASRCRAAG